MPPIALVITKQTPPRLAELEPPPLVMVTTTTAPSFSVARYRSNFNSSSQVLALSSQARRKATLHTLSTYNLAADIAALSAIIVTAAAASMHDRYVYCQPMLPPGLQPLALFSSLILLLPPLLLSLFPLLPPLILLLLLFLLPQLPSQVSKSWPKFLKLLHKQSQVSTPELQAA